MKPINAIRIIALILLLFGVETTANAQAFFFGGVSQTTQAACVSGQQCPLLAIPGATIQVCIAPACASIATTYTDQTAASPCPVNAQVVAPGSTACVATSDTGGNFGFWVLAGNYNYYVTPPGSARKGPYPFSVTAAIGYLGTPPVVIAGSAISCPTCLTTAGGQTIAGTDTFTAPQVIEAPLMIAKGGGPASGWTLSTVAPTLLEFSDSTGSLRAYLDATGTPLIGGTGVELVAPSIYAKSTAAASPSMVVVQPSGGTADILDVENSALAKSFYVDSSGVTHITSCVGCGSNSVTAPITLAAGVIGCATCLTTAGSQTIIGTDIFQTTQVFEGAVQFYNGSSGPQWQIVSNSPNLLLFQDSSSTTRMTLNAAGTAGIGILLSTPSLVVSSTNTITPTAVFAAFPSQSSDVLDVTSPGGIVGTKYLWVDSTGGTHIANCVAGCGGTPTVASPVNISGGAITCTTCRTTAGGATVTGVDTYTAGVAATLFNSTAVGAALAFQSGSGNFQVDGGGNVSGAGKFATTSEYDVVAGFGGPAYTKIQATSFLQTTNGTNSGIYLASNSSVGGTALFYNASNTSLVQIFGNASRPLGGMPVNIGPNEISILNSVAAGSVGNFGNSSASAASSAITGQCTAASGLGCNVFIGTSGATGTPAIVLNSSAGIDSGSGTPPYSCLSATCLYIRTNGGAGTVGYVWYGAAWHAVF